MNKEISLRQIAYMFLFLTISPMLRQIPNALAQDAGRSGYLSPIWALAALLPLTVIILLIIKSYPGLNLYEIMEQVLGKVMAKILILAYLFWILLQLVTKINAYCQTLQFTLMPKTRSSEFIVIMIVLVFYSLLRGMKTIFRFAEFVLGPILFFFVVVFLSALSRIRLDYLLPISTAKVPATIFASKTVISVGGILIIALFFADKLNISPTRRQKRKIWYSVIIFVLVALLLTFFTFGVTGADLTANLPFPLYIAMKSISFFGVAERFEVMTTLICVLSDFIFICVLSTLLMRCIQWLFKISDRGFLFVPLAMIVYYLSFFLSSTQFELQFLYRNVLVNLDLIFEYLIPFFLGAVCILRRKHIRQQY